MYGILFKFKLLFIVVSSELLIMHAIYAFNLFYLQCLDCLPKAVSLNQSETTLTYDVCVTSVLFLQLAKTTARTSTFKRTESTVM